MKSLEEKYASDSQNLATLLNLGKDYMTWGTYVRYYGTTDPSQYVSAYGENYIKMNVLQSDVMQNLIDNVKYK